MGLNSVTEASRKTRDELIKINGVMGVVMFQIESANLLGAYHKNENKPTWKIVCSFFNNLSGSERVTKEVYLDKETGEVVDLNGHQ